MCWLPRSKAYYGREDKAARGMKQVITLYLQSGNSDMKTGAHPLCLFESV